MISGKYHLKTHFFLFSLSVQISDYHPFLKNGCLIENKMHGASTQLGPVSHKCKLVGARVFPGRHVYGASVEGYYVVVICGLCHRRHLTLICAADMHVYR